MLIPRALLAPHPPTLLEDEHRRHRTPMLDALAREGRRLRAEQPAIVVVLSARRVSNGPFQVGTGKFHRTLTDDPGFGVEARYDCPGHPALARSLVLAGERAGVHVGPAQRGVDGGVSVPMHFLAPARDLPVVPLSMARRPGAECRVWGETLRRVLAERPERIGFVVGGMLSHATHAWNFRREVPEAAALDEHVIQALTAGRWEALSPPDPAWVRKAQPEAELRHLEVLRGFLGGDVPGELLCYEAAPGMGSVLMAFPVPDTVSVAPAEGPVVEAPPTAAMASRRPRPPRPAPRPARPAFRPARPASRPPRGKGTPVRGGGEGSGRGASPTGGMKRARGGVSAASRTSTARARPRASRPARKPRG